jgi:hypothetical protein
LIVSPATSNSPVRCVVFFVVGEVIGDGPLILFQFKRFDPSHSLAGKDNKKGCKNENS